MLVLCTNTIKEIWQTRFEMERIRSGNGKNIQFVIPDVVVLAWWQTKILIQVNRPTRAGANCWDEPVEWGDGTSSRSSLAWQCWYVCHSSHGAGRGELERLELSTGPGVVVGRQADRLARTGNTFIVVPVIIRRISLTCYQHQDITPT